MHAIVLFVSIVYNDISCLRGYLFVLPPPYFSAYELSVASRVKNVSAKPHSSFKLVQSQFTTLLILHYCISAKIVYEKFGMFSVK